jgi:nucleotide-binding universal stress UspA family protein
MSLSGAVFDRSLNACTVASIAHMHERATGSSATTQIGDSEMHPSHDDALQLREHRVVVGIDGSRDAVDLLHEAARIARASGSQLESVAVWQPQQILLDYGEMECNPELASRQTLFDVSKFVFGPEQPGWYTTSSVEGDPATVLITRSANAEVLIVGSSTRNLLLELMMGSVARQCARRASCPVLLVPPTARTLRCG